MGVGQCSARASVAALQAVGAQQTSHAVVCVVHLCITRGRVCVCVDAGLDPGHMAILGCPAQVLWEGGDWDVIGQLMGFHCAHLAGDNKNGHI